MSVEDFSDSTLVLIGHGSTVNTASAAPTYQHAAELRRRGLFGRVVEAFWKQEPAIRAVMSGVTAPRVFAVPLFISEGYFTQEIIPRELGLLGQSPTPIDRERACKVQSLARVQKRGAQTIYYCGPIGTHPSMTEVLLARARDVVAKFPGLNLPPVTADITLFIAGHGTNNNENSRRAIERQMELIRARGIYADVHAVFMEEEPRIADCSKMARTRHLVVVPLFMSEGLHVQEDIPVLLGEAPELVQARLSRGEPTWQNPTDQDGLRIWYAPSVGSEPHIADVILERVREMARSPRRDPPGSVQSAG
jgi:sirohydrochlorin cobaltochelatase